MAGLGVLFFVGLYFFVAYKIVRVLKTARLKWLAILILALIPTADAIVGRIYLQHLCATEGGLKVHRMAQGVDGFISDGGDSGMQVEKHGYKFSESAPINGRVNKYSKANGHVVREKDVIPISKYRVRFETTGQNAKYRRQTFIVETFPDGIVIATDTLVGFNGGWAEDFISQFGGGGRQVAWCKGKDSLVRRDEIVSSTLKH